MGENARYLFRQVLGRVKEKRHLIQAVVGPRQVGKTTLCRQVLSKVSRTRILARYHAADSVPVADGKWIDDIWESLRRIMIAQGAGEALLIIDEVQNIDDWSRIIKKNWDSDSFNKVNIKVIVLGSSRALLKQGLSESLLGRFELNVLGHWSFSEMRDTFGFTPEQYVYFGAYPGAVKFIGNDARFKEYIRNSIIESVVSKDVLQLTRVNKPALLRQLANVGISYSSQIVSYNKLLSGFGDAGNTTTLSHYVQLLDEAGIVSGLQKYTRKDIIIKQSIPKFQVHNQSLYTSLQPQPYVNVVSDSALWGRFVESAVGTHLIAERSRLNGGKIWYWRESEGRNTYEVDFIFEYKGKILAMEVKSGGTRARSFAKFRERFPDAMTLIVGKDGMPWQDFIAGKIEHFF
jgi:predicted AAA+ superfamily ATPase